jgi:glycosyltransferase involved in cell wall biosynthesis
MNLAIIIPWFGRELKGGAEQQAWQIAARLARRKHKVEVLTTCCRSHQDNWETNHLPAGCSAEPEGFAIRRFPVDKRDRPAFDRVCAQLLAIPGSALKPGVSPLGLDDAIIFRDELIKSQALLEYLRANREKYEWFLFLPYLYSPILQGIPIVAERAVLQPCLHNEAYAYLPVVADVFYLCARLLFNSEGEQELAFQLFGPGIWSRSRIVGEGIEVETELSDSRNGATSRHSGQGTGERFVLYLGRKDAGKNVPLLVNAFSKFRKVRPNSDLRLILAGHGSIDLNGCSGITDLGLVSDAHKAQLLQDCVALVQPSANESFSRTMMEAWQCGRPVAAQASCLATSVAVQRSGGGWLAETEQDWAGLFTVINRASEREIIELGEKGRSYAQDIADWEKVIDRYEQALALPKKRSAATAQAKVAIHQVLPNLSHGDAISNQALFIRDTLRKEGFVSNIYVRYVDPRVASQCSLFSSDKIAPRDAIIYHHSIGTELTPQVVAHPGPKLLIYHNITPGEFFDSYRPAFAEILRTGRRQLREIAPFFPHSAGDSRFNADELKECGFANPSVLPISVDPAKWEIGPDPKWMEQLQDGRTNLLFVGRIAPNKKQDDLVRAFQIYLEQDNSARLILPGAWEPHDPYYILLRDRIASSGLLDSVLMPGSVTDAELAAFYRSAHLFWSMSEHEGFCVPLIEAMWFDVPVLAFRSTAVPETLGEAGLLFTDKSSFESLAGLALLLVHNNELRGKVTRAQRRQRLAFLHAKVAPLLEIIIARMLTSPNHRAGDVPISLEAVAT